MTPLGIVVVEVLADFAERRADRTEFVAVEKIDHVSPDALDVMRCRALEDPAPVRSQHGEHHPAVLVGSHPLDEPARDETVEAPGQAARGELESASEIGHAEPIVIGLRQVDENLVIALEEPVLGEVGFKGSEEVGAGLDE